MQSLPHQADVGAPAPAPGTTLHDLRPAQHNAVMRWFTTQPLAALDAAIQRNPQFPLIDCNPDARAFAPARGKPAPAPQGGAA